LQVNRRIIYTPVLATGSSIVTPDVLFGANLIAWFKADTQVYNTGTTLATNGQTVSQWTDQSGNANHLTQNGGIALPVWQSAGLNGKPAVNFVIANATCLALVSHAAYGATTSYAMFGIASTTANSRGLDQSSSITIGDSGFATILELSADGSIPAIGGGFGATVTVTESITTNATHRVGLNCDGANLTPYVDGVAGTPAAHVHALSNSGFIAINGSLTTKGWDGPISELIIVNRAVTAPELITLDTYLASRQ
jgi:hypothetical protein